MKKKCAWVVEVYWKGEYVPLNIYPTRKRARESIREDLDCALRVGILVHPKRVVKYVPDVVVKK